MPSQYPYRETIRNKYLGVSKVIHAMTRSELNWLIDAQLAKWQEQETRKREQRQKDAERLQAWQQAVNLKTQAEEDTKAAQDTRETFQSILTGSLGISMALDWEQLLDRRSFSAFRFSEPKPDRDQIRLQILGPKPTERAVAFPVPERAGFLEFFLPFLRRRRLQRIAEAAEKFENETRLAKSNFHKRLKEYASGEKEVLEAYNSAVRTYNAKLKQEKETYTRERETFIAHQESHNSAVIAFRARYETGSPEAVERYVQMVLARSAYPESIAGEPDARFEESSQTLIVSFWLPGPSDVPNIVEYKYVSSRKAIKPVEMKQKDFQAFYDDIIHQIALRTMHEAFVADYARHIDAVVFNGWVRGIDPKTGKEFTSCILSCEVSRKQFMELDLAHVSPKECIRGLKGITAGPLIMLAPVKPILELKRDDDRFVESKEILDHLRPEDNLAAMEWEDFEHMVRELFEKEFALTGGEVRVTQASRDRGVDAIAFDPEPIRGGKFVIQAKRYNIVVPVSDVRDLYGTMIAEGATKGILVTTSYYGRDSREFAKDKPITLIDGENLVHMFQKHGHNVHIAILQKGDPRRGLGSVASNPSP
jgi:restriction system protein